MIRLLLIALLACLLSSCAGSIKVSTRGCQSMKTEFAHENMRFAPNVVWQEKYWTYGGGEDSSETTNLGELLADREIDCKKVKFLRLTTGQTFWDQIFSIVPFIQRMTLNIELMTES